MNPIPDILALTAQYGPMGPHGPMGDGWGGWMEGSHMVPWLGPWTSLLVMVLGLTTLAAVLYGAVYLATRGLADGQGGRHAPDDAVDVLDRRYARGEVDDEEYDTRRRRLIGD